MDPGLICLTKGLLIDYQAVLPDLIVVFCFARIPLPLNSSHFQFEVANLGNTPHLTFYFVCQGCNIIKCNLQCSGCTFNIRVSLSRAEIIVTAVCKTHGGPGVNTGVTSLTLQHYLTDICCSKTVFCTRKIS